MAAKARYRVAWQSPNSRRADASEANGLRNLKCRNPLKSIFGRRAYELWEQEGGPDGRDQEFYHQAEQELQQAKEQPSPEQPRLYPFHSFRAVKELGASTIYDRN